MKTISLVEMRENQKGRVAEIEGGLALRQRLMGLGIYPGLHVLRLSHFALKGPVMIRVGRSTLALGHSMAGKIKVSLE